MPPDEMLGEVVPLGTEEEGRCQPTVGGDMKEDAGEGSLLKAFHQPQLNPK